MSYKLVDVVSQQHVGSHHGVECSIAHTIVAVPNLPGNGLEGLGRGGLTYVDTVLLNQTPHLLQALCRTMTTLSARISFSSSHKNQQDITTTIKKTNEKINNAVTLTTTQITGPFFFSVRVCIHVLCRVCSHP